MDIYKLILIYQFLSYIQSQIIPLNYSLSVNDFAVIVLISEPHEYKHFYIDMVTNFTWASFSYYNRLNSATVSKLGTNTVPFGSREIDFEILQDELFFPQHIKNFTFYYSMQYLGCFDTLSFSHTFLDQRTSFTYNLYSQHLIEYNRFGIDADTFENGMLFLGDLPGNASSNVRNVFNVPKNKVTWNVDISTLIIKGKEYENKEDNFEAIFQFRERRILIPKKVQQFINEQIFNRYKENKICAYNSGYGYNFYTCDCKIEEDIKSIIFIMNDKEVEISMKNLLRKMKYDDCQFLIEENIMNENQWVLGMPFFNEYKAIFDYETDTVTLFSKNKFKNHFTYNKTPLSLIIINNVINLSGIFLLLYINVFK